MSQIEIRRGDQLICTYDPITWKFEPAPNKKTETEFLYRLWKRTGTIQAPMGHYYDVSDYPEFEDDFDLKHLLAFIQVLEQEDYQAYYQGKRLKLKLVDVGDLVFD